MSRTVAVIGGGYVNSAGSLRGLVQNIAAQPRGERPSASYQPQLFNVA